MAEDINIIVLADMRSDFTEEEFRNFDAYLGVEETCLSWVNPSVSSL